MSKGKEKCEFLREIRKQIAAKYGLDYSPAECRHEGDCRGTCPMCDKEVSDLIRQLDEKGQTEIRLADLSSILIGKEEDDKNPDRILEEEGPLDGEVECIGEIIDDDFFDDDDDRKGHAYDDWDN